MDATLDLKNATKLKVERATNGHVLASPELMGADPKEAH